MKETEEPVDHPILQTCLIAGLFSAGAIAALAAITIAKPEKHHRQDGPRYTQVQLPPSTPAATQQSSRTFDEVFADLKIEPTTRPARMRF